MTNDNYLNEVLTYSKQGLKVFPLIPNQKRPIKDYSYLKATNEPEEIFNIFNKEEKYNVGVNLKEASLIVLDLDCHSEQQDGIAWLSSKSNESLENDCVVSTPRNGLHVYYSLNGFDIPNKLELADGVEILTDFCTLPPSYVDMPKDGAKGSYTLVSGSFDAIQPIPQWLMNNIQVKQGNSKITLNFSDKGRTSKTWTATFLEELVQGVDESQRNIWITSKLGKLLSLGMNSSEAYQFIHVINENFVTPKLPENEVNAIFKSIIKAESRKAVKR